MRKFVSCKFWTTKMIDGTMKKYNHKRSISIFAPFQLSPTPSSSLEYTPCSSKKYKVLSSYSVGYQLFSKKKSIMWFLKGHILDFSYYTVINESKLAFEQDVQHLHCYPAASLKCYKVTLLPSFQRLTYKNIIANKTIKDESCLINI